MCRFGHTKYVVLLCAFLLGAAITGCGQKGPLEYTPAQQERVDARDKARREQAEAEAREREALEESAAEDDETSTPSR